MELIIIFVIIIIIVTAASLWEIKAGLEHQNYNLVGLI